MAAAREIAQDIYGGYDRTPGYWVAVEKATADYATIIEKHIRAALAAPEAPAAGRAGRED
jgi:hypothetical protein